MNYKDWLTSIPEAITKDPLWTIEAYRLALFVADIGWLDVTRLSKDLRTRALSDQLYRALGSIGANVSEGLSRGSGKDRARFYEYALGSARESRTWYFNARHLLGTSIGQHRMQLLAQIVRLLLVMVPDQRRARLKEDPVPYSVQGTCTEGGLDDLLSRVPLP